MFRPLHGHCQGVLQGSNTIMADSVRNVQFFGGKNKMFSNIFANFQQLKAHLKF